MFTGIVRERGRVAGFDGTRLVVETTVEATVGDSVAVDGVCLTVVAGDVLTLEFDVVPETLSRTTVGDGPGLVNLGQRPRGRSAGGHMAGP
jgi:riboflavin synthase